MSLVMVVDDEERVRTMLARSLTGDGHSVVVAADGSAALEELKRQQVDLVLLDVMMPRYNGLEVLSSLRQSDDSTPVIVVSGVGDVSTRIQALDGGAIDFVSKPFHPAELVARVRRHVSQARAPRGDQRFLTAGGIRLDLDRRRARTQDREAALTEREFTLLAHLMRRRGDVCRRSELLHDVWGLEFDPGSNVIEVCLRRVRSKLPGLPVETIRGVGYCFYGDSDA